MSRTLIALMPPHRTYVEVFGGGGQVLFRKRPSEVEVLNDIDDDVITLYRVVQHHWEEFVRYLRFQLTSRRAFEIWSLSNPTTLTDVQRAVRFFMLQKLAFGGLVRKRAYHFFISKRPNFNPGRVREVIEAIHHRLANVQIESLPFERVLKTFDSDQTAFYLDPPYVNRALYNHNFTVGDFESLATCLGEIRGKFMLTVSDDPEMRDLFSPFHLFTTSIVYTANRDGRKTFQELIATNYEPDPLPDSVRHFNDAHSLAGCE